MAGYEQWTGRIERTELPRHDGRPAQLHELTREQFARHPHTLWHATPSGGMGDGVIHFGTHKAAYTALKANMGSGSASGLEWQPDEPVEKLHAELAEPKNHWRGKPKDWHAEPAFIPLIVAPERLDEMVDVHTQLGKSFNGGDMQDSGDGLANELVRPYSPSVIEYADFADQQRAGYWYRNESEDVGSVSGVVPHKSWLLTHEQIIQRALSAGLPVPAHVLAQYPALKPSLSSVTQPAAELGLRKTPERQPRLGLTLQDDR